MKEIYFGLLGGAVATMFTDTDGKMTSMPWSTVVQHPYVTLNMAVYFHPFNTYQTCCVFWTLLLNYFTC